MPHVHTPVTPADKLAFLDFRRYETYLRDVIEPAVYPESEAIEAAVCVLADPRAEVMKPGVNRFDPSTLAYTPVKPVWNWGPKWSTAWFRVRGNVPKSFAGRKVVLRFSSGTEGQIWTKVSGGSGIGFTPRQGLDVNRDAFALLEGSANGGEAVEVFVEAACNHPFGAGGFEWDGSEVHARWNSETPGRFERCEIAVRDEVAWELRQLYAFSVGLMAELAFDSTRFNELRAALREATNAHPGGAEYAVEVLGATLKSPAAGSATRCMAVGHAHLDTAWLWPIRESRRKLIRTFTNQLGLMERFPEYRFLASQALHYAWIEEDAPEVFEQIKKRVAEGRWEPGGGMWVEPDVNCVSGESLVRQILHGARYWESKFGERGKQTFLFLPDTFGFGANLPQIMRLAGLETFITNKLHWWQHTTFPHTTFMWRGIDGTAVLAHNTPGQDYNATNKPKELRRGEATHRNKDVRPSEPDAQAREGAQPPPGSNDTQANEHLSSLARRALIAPLWLQPFGFGDGGGGATDWSIRFGELSANCDGLPRVEFSRADDFCKALGDQYNAHANFPEWFGELDMEIHRGTLTSQAWIKRANREAEENLRLAEILLCSSPAPSGGGGRVREAGGGVSERADLDRAWKLTLLNQFHDILPGSSIGWVYDDAKKDHAEIQRLVAPIIRGGLVNVGAHLPGTAVFNPSSGPFTGVVEVDGAPMFASDVPSLGVGKASPSLPAGVEPVKTSQRLVISNGLVEVHAMPDQGGTVAVKLRRPNGSLEDVGFLQYFTFEDRPIMWDAWDIDHHYTQKRLTHLMFQNNRILEQSPLRSVIELRGGDIYGCSMVVHITLTAGSPRVDIQHHVDWEVSHRLLRMELFTKFGAFSVCTHGTHFGHQTRPTHRNTAHERARFEFPVQGWLDLSEQGLGLAMMSDCKFGFSCSQEDEGHRIGVSLLRAPTWPDPAADRGEHQFTISLLPHAGDWRAAGVVHQSELLRSPPRALPATRALAPDAV
ncbi:MAG: glycoside hydrolase family 38 C-terminal domain-containing protein, partial [Planctomycetota bacterium]